MNAFLRCSALILTIALAACARNGGSAGQQTAGMEVTRTHLGQPIARGQIAVEAANAADASTPEFPTYAAAVRQQLTRLGWTVLPNQGQGEQVALIDVSDAGGATRLGVGLKRRSEGSVFWQGQATSQPGTYGSAAGRVAAVQRLAEAVFRDFPGESGRTIRLR
jgi:hypothetical protein